MCFIGLYPYTYIFFHFHCRQERDLMTRTDRFGVEVRERVMWDIREGVVGSDTFIPKHVVILTWKNMSFAGGIDNSLFKVSISALTAMKLKKIKIFILSD